MGGSESGADGSGMETRLRLQINVGSDLNRDSVGNFLFFDIGGRV
jgi:hypothetical protein